MFQGKMFWMKPQLDSKVAIIEIVTSRPPRAAVLGGGMDCTIQLDYTSAGVVVQ